MEAKPQVLAVQVVDRYSLQSDQEMRCHWKALHDSIRRSQVEAPHLLHSFVDVGISRPSSTS